MKATRTQRAAATGAQKTVTTSPVTAGAGCEAEFLDLKGVERFFGLKRTLIYEFIRKGAVRSVSLRKPGARTGKRLIYVASLRQFLWRHFDQ
jgi:hypothetical protein